MKTLSKEEAKQQGYATFNRGPHICIDVPDGQQTISVRTSNGKLVTFDFIPYKEGGPANCIDIVQHDTGTVTSNGGRNDIPVQRVLCLGAGPTWFRSEAGKPVTVVAILLDPFEEKDNVKVD